MIIKKHMKKLGVGALSLLLAVSLFPSANGTNTVKAVEDTTIESPVLGNTVTWDCIYFGSYPQGEITEATDNNTYRTLQSSNGWNTDNTLTINNTKYKRIQKGDATSTGASYNWSNDSTYHYFKFEPIKWRVIDVNGNSAYLISDVVLDTQKYNQEAKAVSWNTSTLRSWLNGYDKSANQTAIDYRTSNFLNTAFSSKEKEVLVSTNNDMVTILSEADMKNNYGLDNANNRTCKSSTFAQAMGAHQNALGAFNWWTSTNGNSNLTAKYIEPSGEVYTKGYSVAYAGNGVRVAVRINLNQTDAYRYAGTVSSDGAINEVVTTTAPTNTPEATPENTQPVTSATPIVTVTFTPTVTLTATPTETIMTPTVVPTKTATTTTKAPTTVPNKTTTVTATTVPTVVPTQAPTATIAVPVPTVAPTTNENTTISKDSVWYHSASNGEYRVTKINSTTAKDGTIGTVAYLGQIKTTKTSATIPAKVTIENQTFKVTSIAKGAFAGNKKLKKVVIGKNIKKINANAFKGCKKLSKITIKTTGLTKTSIGKNAFKNISKKATIQVPSTKLKKYKKFIKAAGAPKTVVFKK